MRVKALLKNKMIKFNKQNKKFRNQKIFQKIKQKKMVFFVIKFYSMKI